MRVCRVGLTVGSAVGWIGGAAVGVLGLGLHTLPAMMFLLSLAIFCSGALAMRCYQRPLEDAYDLGYSRGRRDAIREATRATYAMDVTPIRGSRPRAVTERPRSRV